MSQNFADGRLPPLQASNSSGAEPRTGFEVSEPTGVRMATNSSRYPHRSGQLHRLGALAFAALGLVAPVAATTFSVNSIVDIPDVSPGNGICETAVGNGVCTLRAAVQETNAKDGADVIMLQPNTTYTLTRVGDDSNALNGDLDISDSVTIVGDGPDTVVDGNGALTQDRVFHIPAPCIDNAGFPPNCLQGIVVANLSGLTIQHGTAVNVGGGISNLGELTVDHCVITGNSLTGALTAGGGIENLGSLVLTNSIVANNTTAGTGSISLGAGVYSAGILEVDGTAFSGNHGAGPGGGLGIYGSTFKALVRDSTFNGNSASLGGGIYNTGSTLTLTNSTVSANSSDGAGGGIYAESGTTGLYNVTVTSNRANSDGLNGGDGGGVLNLAGSTFLLSSSIVAGNDYFFVESRGDPPTLKADDCSGAYQAQAANLLKSISAAHCTINGPHVVALAQLGPLQDNGGVTATHALLAGSPAIDAGASCPNDQGAALPADQRGVARPQGAACDIGAFELQELIFADGFEPPV